MYFCPACLASLAQARAAFGFGWKRLASCSYSVTGMPSFSITHSWRPSTLYRPQWMNMPNRASCHHCMRRARSASSASELFCTCGCAGAAPVFGEAARVSRDAPVPTSQSRRGMPFGFMSSDPPVVIAMRLRSQLENSFHQQPLFARFGLLQRLLKRRHQFFPFADFGICAICFGFGVEGKPLVHFHHHEHARSE